jgi:hypothetical protein
MTAPKNIVIKVKYPTPGAAAEPPLSNVKMITEWNIKRIAGAVSVLIVLIAALFILLAGNSGPKDVAENKAAPQPALSDRQRDVQTSPELPSRKASSSLEKQTEIPNSTFPRAESAHSELSAPATGSGGRIRRAALAYRIVDKEPADLIEENVIINRGKAIPVYYFTEVRGRTAQILFHEWRKDGQMMLRHPVAIAADRWRTSSQRELGADDRGHWSVRTVDDHGTVMNEIHFTVSAE